MTAALRQASGDGPEVLFAVLGVVGALGGAIYFLKRSHYATQYPHLGKTASRGANAARKVGESVGVLAAAAGVSFVVSMIVGGINFAIHDERRSPSVESPSAIDPLASELRAVVEQSKGGMVPQKLDPITTMTDMTAEGRTWVYHYTLSENLEASHIESFRPRVVGQVCGNPDMVKMLRMGIGFRYSYTTPTIAAPVAFSISVDDCVGAWGKQVGPE